MFAHCSIVFDIKNLPMILAAESFTFGEVSDGSVRVTISEDLLRNQLAQGIRSDYVLLYHSSLSLNGR